MVSGHSVAHSTLPPSLPPSSQCHHDLRQRQHLLPDAPPRWVSPPLPSLPPSFPLPFLPRPLPPSLPPSLPSCCLGISLYLFSHSGFSPEHTWLTPLPPPLPSSLPPSLAAAWASLSISSPTAVSRRTTPGSPGSSSLLLPLLYSSPSSPFWGDD